jgi:hypothetical protein
MPQDKRYDPKQFRNGNSPRPPKQPSIINTIKSIGIWALIALALMYVFNEARNQNIEPTSQRTSSFIPDIKPPQPAIPEEPFPESGSTIQYQTSYPPTASFTVISEQGNNENCVIKLEFWNTGQPVIELYVRAGEQATNSEIPLGAYRVKIACGRKWYGKTEMFGRQRTTSIGRSPLEFFQNGNTINGQILNLNKRPDGNFQTDNSYLNKF